MIRRQTSSQLSGHHGRNQHLFRILQDIGRGRFSASEIDISIGIDSDSPPKALVNRILFSECLVELGVVLPFTGEIPEVATADTRRGEAGIPAQRLEHDLIQAGATFPGPAAKDAVEKCRYVAEGILHAVNVGNAGRHRNAAKTRSHSAVASSAATGTTALTIPSP